MEKQYSDSSFSIERKNRIVFILTLIFILSVFMDYQARRHQKVMGTEINPVASPKNVTDPDGSANWELQGDQIVERQSAAKIIGPQMEAYEAQVSSDDKGMEQSVMGKHSTFGTKPILAQAHNILGKFTHIREGYHQAVEEQTKAELQQLAAKPMRAVRILADDKRLGRVSHSDIISYRKRRYFLYFIRFDGKKSNFVRVSRFHEGSTLRLGRVLEELRKGPSSRENNLLNNFDRRMKINSVIASGRVAIVDLNNAIGRMGKHVIEDRLEQIAHTLTQFEQIDYVKILIQGKTLSRIGNPKVVLPQALRPRRPSLVFVP